MNLSTVFEKNLINIKTWKLRVFNMFSTQLILIMFDYE